MTAADALADRLSRRKRLLTADSDIEAWRFDILRQSRVIEIRREPLELDMPVGAQCIHPAAVAWH
jgi:hypothetical protein